MTSGPGARLPTSRRQLARTLDPDFHQQLLGCVEAVRMAGHAGLDTLAMHADDEARLGWAGEGHDLARGCRIAVWAQRADRVRGWGVPVRAAEVLLVVVIIAASILRVATDGTAGERRGITITVIAVVVATIVVFAVAVIGNRHFSPNAGFVLVGLGAVLMVALRIKDHRRRAVAATSAGDRATDVGNTPGI